MNSTLNLTFLCLSTSFSLALMCMSFTDHKISDFIARQLAFAESKRKSPHYVSECSLCENVGEDYHTHLYVEQIPNTYDHFS